MEVYRATVPLPVPQMKVEGVVAPPPKLPPPGLPETAVDHFHAALWFGLFACLCVGFRLFVKKTRLSRHPMMNSMESMQSIVGFIICSLFCQWSCSS